MFSLSTLKQKVADLFKTDLHVFAFRIYTPAINEIPSPSGKYVDFLTHIAEYAGQRNMVADIHFVYQKTTRERHLKCSVFERNVIVVMRATDHSELEKAFDYAKNLCSEFEFFPVDQLLKLTDDTQCVMPTLNIKTCLTEALDNSIDLFARVGQFPVYIRSFCAVPHKEKGWGGVKHYTGVTTAGQLKDPNYISEPAVSFLTKIANNCQSNLTQTIISFEELRKFFETEYFYHTVLPGRTHVFSGIEGHYSEFFTIDRLGEYNHIGVILDSDPEGKHKAGIQEKLEHNLFRTSPGFVEFFSKPNASITEYRPITEFSCLISEDTKHYYSSFLSNILKNLSKKPLSPSDTMALGQFIPNITLEALLNCMENCLAHENVISRKTLIRNLPSKFQHLLEYLSNDYEVSCTLVNGILNTNYSTITDYFDKNSKNGAFVLVDFENVQLFNFMLNHLCEIDYPSYKGKAFYVHIPADLIIHLDLRVIRQFRKFYINFVAYGSYAEWVEIKNTNFELYEYFRNFFINCDVFNTENFDENLLPYQNFEQNALDRLKKFGPDYYYVQNEGAFHTKKCLIKI